MDGADRIVAAIEKMGVQLGEKLDEHTLVLKAQSILLENQGAVLARIDNTLTEHGETLKEISDHVALTSSVAASS